MSDVVFNTKTGEFERIEPKLEVKEGACAVASAEDIKLMEERIKQEKIQQERVQHEILNGLRRRLNQSSMNHFVIPPKKKTTIEKIGDFLKNIFD